MDLVTDVALVFSALIHALPVAGVLGPSRVAAGYDVRVDGPDLSVLLVHRAVMFGVLAGLLVAAVWSDDLLPYAVGATLASDVAFLVVVGVIGGINPSMRRVVRADIVSIVLLVVAAATSRVG
ncbi:hypothetical protein [Aeromicrobium sp.]|uniref:hypothetical protein n=1 Tax=Aeromicrobium sp. TaxID=1871063 RepID=UPI0030C3A58D